MSTKSEARSKQAVEQMVDVWPKLVAAASEMRRCMRELVTTASDLAGCDLDGWSSEEIDAYVDLFLETYREPSYWYET